MKILITGASGFIGRNLAESLAGKYEIVAPSSQELDLVDDVAVRDYFNGNLFDAVIHCAGVRGNRRIGSAPDLLERNCRMFFNVVRNQSRFGKMIYFGSGAEYGLQGVPSMATEEDFDAQVPNDAYGLSKYIFSKYSEDRDIINLRLFSIFGKYEDASVRFISNACSRAVLGLPIVVKQNGIFDYMSAEDLARIVEFVIEREMSHNIYNACPSQPKTLIELATAVAEISKPTTDVPVEVVNANVGREYTGSNARLMSELGGFKFTPIASAIRKLYNWFEECEEEIDCRYLHFDAPRMAVQ
jgi:UDP-glucose 4-epimerase